MPVPEREVKKTVVDKVADFIEEFVFIRTPAIHRLIALWIVATHMYEQFEFMGYLFAHSPEPTVSSQLSLGAKNDAVSRVARPARRNESDPFKESDGAISPRYVSGSPPADHVALPAAKASMHPAERWRRVEKESTAISSFISQRFRWMQPGGPIRRQVAE